jgi:hypothetical protein
VVIPVTAAGVGYAAGKISTDESSSTSSRNRPRISGPRLLQKQRK